MSNKTVIYVNYSPYENTGNILDFLLSQYNYIFLFSLNFHRLGKKQESNKLLIYKKGKLVKTHNLFQIPANNSFLYLLLPLRSIINLLQIFWYSFTYRKEVGKYHIFFTVNAFTAWIGILLKKFGLVNKTVFWVWDYYPPLHKNKLIVFMRWIYWQFDKFSTSYSDRVVFLNKRLEELRKDIGILNSNASYKIVPIGTNPVTSKRNLSKVIRLCFIGVLKKSQGLDLFFDNVMEITMKHPNLHLDILGTGPDEKYFLMKNKKTKNLAHFHGLIDTDSNKAKKIFADATIGIAPYIPEEGNISYYGDPSKIKLYLSYGLPVITTNVFIFSNELKRAKGGKIITYDGDAFIKALDEILKNYLEYSKNAMKLAQKFSYKKIYKELFI